MAKPLISLEGNGVVVGSDLALFDTEGVFKIGYNWLKVFLNHKAILNQASVKIRFFTSTPSDMMLL